MVATPGALESLARSECVPLEYLRRHASGDWGSVCSEDRAANDDAVKTGARILSSYVLADNTKIWVITDAIVDGEGMRPSTALILPEEY